MFSLDHRAFLEQDFAIIDPLLVDATLCKRLPAEPLGKSEFNCNADQLPRLVNLRDADERARLELLEVAEVFSATQDVPFFCALIRTAESAASLGQRLSRKLVLTRVRQRRAYFFRFFDPRVFLHLQRILRPEQLRALLSPAQAWVWFDPLAQRWCEHRVSDGPGAQPASHTRLNWDEEQFDALSRIELLNRVLLRLRSDQPKKTIGAQQVQAIDACVVRAINAERLGDPDAQVRFVMHAILHGNRNRAATC
jgi:hypothetical protein